MNFAIDYVLARKEKFTAIVAADDLRAFEIYDILRSKGIKVPEDCSLIGNGDIYFSALAGLRLTTVKNPIWEICLELNNAMDEFISTGKLDIRKKFKPVIISRNTVSEIKP